MIDDQPGSMGCVRPFELSFTVQLLLLGGGCGAEVRMLFDQSWGFGTHEARRNHFKLSLRSP